MGDEILAVASPEYVVRNAIRAPEDLARCRLIRSTDDSWAAWFAGAGLDRPDPDAGLFFDDFSLALTWAQNGQGATLTRRSLATESLRRGTLVQLFDIALPDERKYWFVTPTGIQPTPLLVKFRDWVFAEVRS
jgi:LysR family glycine cleavage system transcriptional activator